MVAMQARILSTIEKVEKVSSTTKKGKGRRESERGREGGREGGSQVRRISTSPVVESSY